MSTEREDLINEANGLELEFHSNIPTTKLQGLIAEAKGEPPAVNEPAPAGPALKAGASTEVPDEEAVETVKPKLSRYAAKRQKIVKAKQAAMKTKVVTITNKDNRENDIMTTAYLSFENQHFGLSKVVPLDIPVQLEVSLIHIAENTIMTLHKDEIIGGKRTGNKVPVRVKKFAFSYGQTQPE